MYLYTCICIYMFILVYFLFEICWQGADIDEKQIRREKPEDLVMAIAEAKVISLNLTSIFTHSGQLIISLGWEFSDSVLIQCVIMVLKELDLGNPVQLQCHLQQLQKSRICSNIWTNLSGWCNSSQAQRKWFRRGRFWADSFDYSRSGTVFHVAVVY